MLKCSIPIPHIHNVGFDEMSEYVSMINFQYLPQVMWSEDYWKSLPQDIKDIMIEVGKEAALYEQ